MLSKIQALAIIDAPANIFQCGWFTASRDAWKKYKSLTARAEKLRKKADREKLMAEAAALGIGGRYIAHARCASMRTRGIHAKLEAAEARHSISYRANPRHYKNRTRNIKLLPTHDVRKLHISLLMEVNNQNVLY